MNLFSRRTRPKVIFNNRPSFHNQQPQFVPVYTHVIDQPIEPVAETHNLDVEVSSVIETADLAIDTGSPLPIEPTPLTIINTIVESTEIHYMAVPETPDVAVPETPDVAVPETPEEPVPETPDVAVPETPVVAVPETPEEPAPETPEEPAPETPEEPAPEIPEEPAPETPEEPAPETPVVAVPETPVVAVPETPEEPAPETPEEPAPETPEEPVSETPVVAVSGTPEEPAPETPEEPVSETPVVAVSETPEEPAPETPEEPAPETPEEPAPETPVVAVPETPVVAVPETPVVAVPETPEEPVPETPEEPVPETPEEPVPETPAALDIHYDNLPTFYIFGDSHAFYNFNDLRYDDVTLTYINCWKSGSSISSVVKTNIIPNYKSDYLDPNNAFLFCYGENKLNIYIKEESESGKNEDDIIQDLVNQFFSVVTNTITTCRKIIVMALIPPTEFEFTTTKFREPTTLTNSYEERVRYQQKMNQSLNNKCSEIGALFFHPFSTYTNDNGCLKNEFIKSNVHINNNKPILKAFSEQILSVL